MRNRMIAGIYTLVILGGISYVMERTLNDYHLTVVEFLGIYVILAVSLALTNSFTGLFSLGHPAFMAIGAYISAILTFPPIRKAIMMPALPHFLANMQLPFCLAVIIGGVIAALSAFIIGFPVLRLRGHYLAVATIGFMIIVQVLITNMNNLTRGPLGINGIYPYTNIWWVYIWVVVAVYTVWKVLNSRFGRAMLAIREDEIAAESLGISLTYFKLFPLVLGAFFAGVAGGLWAHLVTAITPSSFSLPLAFLLVVMLVIGGKSITGAIVGALLIGIVSELLRPIEMATQLYGLTQIVTAVGLLAILIKKPGGIAGSKEISLVSLYKSLKLLR